VQVGIKPFKRVDIHALPKAIFPSGQPCLEGKMTFGEPFEDSGVVRLRTRVEDAAFAAEGTTS